MFKEFKNIAQRSEKLFKRWFASDFFDLFLWTDVDSRKLVKFQLCYNKDADEGVIAWDEKQGVTVQKVDNKPANQRLHSSAIITHTRDKSVDFDSIIDRFNSEAKNLNIKLKAFIVKRINQLKE